MATDSIVHGMMDVTHSPYFKLNICKGVSLYIAYLVCHVVLVCVVCASASCLEVSPAFLPLVSSLPPHFRPKYEITSPAGMWADILAFPNKIIQSQSLSQVKHSASKEAIRVSTLPKSHPMHFASFPIISTSLHYVFKDALSVCESVF